MASGQEDADLAILNARIVNVYSGEILDNCSVGIKGEWIAWVGDAPKKVDETRTRVIDCRRKNRDSRLYRRPYPHGLAYGPG